MQRNTFDRSYNAHVLLYDDDDAVSGGRGTNQPGGFPWNPSGLRFDANLYVETPVSGTADRYTLRAIKAGTADSYFSTAWFAGTSKNGHVVSNDPILKRFNILKNALGEVGRYPTAGDFNSAYPGVEFQFQTTGLPAAGSIFASPGGEDYRVTNSGTVAAWTGVTIGETNPKSVAIQSELLMTAANNPSKVGARFHT